MKVDIVFDYDKEYSAFEGVGMVKVVIVIDKVEYKGWLREDTDE